MSSNYHTPISTGAVANAATVEDPLSELDQAITDITVTEKDGHIIQEEGSDLAQQQRLNFVGNSVKAENDAGNSATKVTVDGSNLGVNVETLSANKTLTDADEAIQVLDPGGADRDVTLPAAAATNHDFTIINADTTYTITVKKPDTSTLDTIEDSSARRCVSDKSADWYIDGAPAAAADNSTTNYTFTATISSNDLIIALKLIDGSDPSTGTPLKVRVANEVLTITSALSVTVPASGGDLFDFDAGKIQGYDCQLFVYLVNNNGTPQLAVSPDPNLQTVATNFYDAAGQTGSAGQTNIVMSGTRDATNSCDVIGRINAQQSDADNWQSPTVSKIVNTPIYETDWLQFLPQYTGFSSAPTGALKYKVFRNNLKLKPNTNNYGTSNATSMTLTGPFKSIAGETNQGLVISVDSGASAFGFFGLAASSRSITIYKNTFGVANFTASGNKGVGGMIDYLVF